jgi:hypothetical protein
VGGVEDALLANKPLVLPDKVDYLESYNQKAMIEMPHKFGITTFVIAIIVSLACAPASLLSQIIPTETATSLTLPTQAEAGSSCGVGLKDHDVLIYVVGQRSQQTCREIRIMIQKQGQQPTNWDGVVLKALGDYDAVCSDVVSGFAYEVVDTGGKSYGTNWCMWVANTYGASGLGTGPDGLGIIRAGQQLQDQSRKTQTATSQATMNARNQNYSNTCKQHNGYIRASGNCVVDYPGWPAQPVTLSPDGTWDSIGADSNRRNCELNAEDAASAAKAGRPWTSAPQYHPDTGVCVHGNP